MKNKIELCERMEHLGELSHQVREFYRSIDNAYFVSDILKNNSNYIVKMQNGANLCEAELIYVVNDETFALHDMYGYDDPRVSQRWKIHVKQFFNINKDLLI